MQQHFKQNNIGDGFFWTTLYMATVDVKGLTDKACEVKFTQEHCLIHSTNNR